MGSYAECWLDTFYIGSTKNDIDPELMLLFRSTDKVALIDRSRALPLSMRRWARTVDDEDEIEVAFYRAPVSVVRDRLELKGYSLGVAREALTASLRAEAAERKSWAAGEHGQMFQADVRILETADADRWIDGLREIRATELAQRSVGGDSRPFAGTLIGYMLEHDWYGYSGPDLRVGIRLALEVCRDADELIYDVTDLISSGYFTLDQDLVEYAESLSSKEYASSGKVIVLTEGRSDSRILGEALVLLYPHLSDYFRFLDFERARLGGGAGNLANLVKAFSGAGIVNRIIAVFDNDTAAEVALKALSMVKLPANIRVVRLPELSELRAYPTIGPSGMVDMDINGVAGSIELYLGKDILVDDRGELSPVQWTGYDSTVRKYQGEVTAKDRVQERFFRRLDVCRGDSALLLQTDWAGIRAILSELFHAFSDMDAEDIIGYTEGYYDR